MNFWKNVIVELEFRKISKKEFSEQTNIPLDTISKGSLRGTSPSVNTAFQVARFLNVNIEYLLENQLYPDENASDKALEINDKSKEIQIYRKNLKFFETFEKMNDKQKQIILDLMQKLSEL